MTLDFVVVGEDRDRPAIGRTVLGNAAIIAMAAGSLLLMQLGRSTPVMVEEPTPGGGITHRLVIDGDHNGQCHVVAEVNGARFTSLLLDSGATGHLFFGRNHATRLGFDPQQLAFTGRYNSANGIGHTSRVQVRQFRIASFVLRDVPADITEQDQDEPVVGIQMLRRLNLQLKSGHCELSWP